LRVLRLFAVLNARFALRKGRTLLSVLAIALGVALGFAVHLINRAAVNELSARRALARRRGGFEVRGGRAGFPGSALLGDRAHGGRRGASPVLEAGRRGSPATERTSA